MGGGAGSAVAGLAWNGAAGWTEAVAEWWFRGRGGGCAAEATGSSDAGAGGRAGPAAQPGAGERATRPGGGAGTGSGGLGQCDAVAGCERELHAQPVGAGEFPAAGDLRSGRGS